MDSVIKVQVDGDIGGKSENTIDSYDVSGFRRNGVYNRLDHTRTFEMLPGFLVCECNKNENQPGLWKLIHCQMSCKTDNRKG